MWAPEHFLWEYEANSGASAPDGVELLPVPSTVQWDFSGGSAVYPRNPHTVTHRPNPAHLLF